MLGKFHAEVRQEENVKFLMEYLAQFCEKLPQDAEVEEILIGTLDNS